MLTWKYVSRCMNSCQLLASYCNNASFSFTVQQLNRCTLLSRRGTIVMNRCRTSPWHTDNYVCALMHNDWYLCTHWMISWSRSAGVHRRGSRCTHMEHVSHGRCQEVHEHLHCGRHWNPRCISKRYGTHIGLSYILFVLMIFSKRIF